MHITSTFDYSFFFFKHSLLFAPHIHRYYQHVDHDHAVPDPAAAERALAEALEIRAGGPPPPKQNNHQNNNNKPLHMMASLARTREAKRQGKEGHIAAQADWGVEGHGSGEEAADEEAREEKAAAFATGSTSLHSLAAEVRGRGRG